MNSKAVKASIYYGDLFSQLAFSLIAGCILLVGLALASDAAEEPQIQKAIVSKISNIVVLDEHNRQKTYVLWPSAMHKKQFTATVSTSEGIAVTGPMTFRCPSPALGRLAKELKITVGSSDDQQTVTVTPSEESPIQVFGSCNDEVQATGLIDKLRDKSAELTGKEIVLYFQLAVSSPKQIAIND